MNAHRYINGSRVTLDSVMDFDTVIKVNKDGFVESNVNILIPDVFDLGNDVFEVTSGWSLLKGFTAQYLYSGALMHPSEFVGGRLAVHILRNPGYYCAVGAYSGDDDEAYGWFVAYRELEDD